jgi:hypothetical protein
MNNTRASIILALNQSKGTYTLLGMFSILKQSQEYYSCQFHNFKEFHSSTTFLLGSPDKRQSHSPSIIQPDKLLQLYKLKDTINQRHTGYNLKNQPLSRNLNHK